MRPTLPLPSELTGRVAGVFWRPNFAFLDELAAALAGKRVLEIFAGNGYLAALLHARGIDIIATTRFSGHDGHLRGLYHDVEELSAVEAVCQYGPERDVLVICWPTVTHAVLKAACAWGTARPIVFIGEVTDYSKNHLGGCATDEFFEAIEVVRRFETYQGNALEQAFECRLRLEAHN